MMNIQKLAKSLMKVAKYVHLKVKGLLLSIVVILLIFYQTSLWRVFSNKKGISKKNS